MRMGKRERLAARMDKANRAIMYDKASQGRDGFKSATPLYHAHVNLGGHGVRGPQEISLDSEGKRKPPKVYSRWADR